MIHDTLIELKMNLKNIYMVPISNLENNAVWLSNLISMVPKFDVFFSGNLFVTQLISQNNSHSFKVVTPRLYRMNQYNGTKIRIKLTKDDTWMNCVSASTCRIISENNGVQRMKMLLEIEKSESADKSKEYPNIK
jgi:nicotinamide-nucleotide adenylyltransferase